MELCVLAFLNIERKRDQVLTAVLYLPVMKVSAADEDTLEIKNTRRKLETLRDQSFWQ